MNYNMVFVCLFGLIACSMSLVILPNDVMNSRRELVFANTENEFGDSSIIEDVDQSPTSGESGTVVALVSPSFHSKSKLVPMPYRMPIAFNYNYLQREWDDNLSGSGDDRVMTASLQQPAMFVSSSAPQQPMSSQSYDNQEWRRPNFSPPEAYIDKFMKFNHVLDILNSQLEKEVDFFNKLLVPYN